MRAADPAEAVGAAAVACESDGCAAVELLAGSGSAVADVSWGGAAFDAAVAAAADVGAGDADAGDADAGDADAGDADAGDADAGDADAGDADAGDADAGGVEASGAEVTVADADPEVVVPADAGVAPSASFGVDFFSRSTRLTLVV